MIPSMRSQTDTLQTHEDIDQIHIEMLNNRLLATQETKGVVGQGIMDAAARNIWLSRSQHPDRGLRLRADTAGDAR